MQWGAPPWLLLLWAVPAAGLLLYGLMRLRENRLRRIMDEQVLTALLPARRRQRLFLRHGLWLAAIALCVMALARPQWGEKWIEVRHMGLDILMVLDTSHSMLADDIRPHRLERAKLGVRDVVHHLRGDRIGLIPFAGESYLYCPLTADYGAFLMMLDDVHAGIIPRGGTAIEQALRQAVQSFDDQVQADRVIILVTDGEDHEGEPLNVLDEMRRRNIRLFAVGVGTPEGTLIPITDERGRTAYRRDREGNIVRTALQEEVLERLATRTGGIYVRATPGDFGLEHIYEQGIAPLQRDVLETETIRIYEEQYRWFLGLALALMMTEALLGDGTRRQRKRRLLSSAGAATIVFILFSVSAHADAPRTWMRRGQQDYEEERFMEAAEAFQEAAERVPDSRLDPARALYNRANALYQQGRYEEAASTYLQALRTTDPNVQHAAHFNRGNALVAHASALSEEQQLGVAKDFAERALESYRHALLLRPDDREAKINHEWADRLREQLEELLAQQPPEPEPQPGDDEEPESDEPDETPQPAPDEPGEDEEPEPSQPQPDKSDAPSEAESPPQEWIPDTMEEMTEDEAMLLLDALREEEQETRDQMRLRLGDPAEAEKDW